MYTNATNAKICNPETLLHKSVALLILSFSSNFIKSMNKPTVWNHMHINRKHNGRTITQQQGFLNNLLRDFFRIAASVKAWGIYKPCFYLSTGLTTAYWWPRATERTWGFGAFFSRNSSKCSGCVSAIDQTVGAYGGGTSRRRRRGGGHLSRGRSVPIDPGARPPSFANYCGDE